MGDVRVALCVQDQTLVGTSQCASETFIRPIDPFVNKTRESDPRINNKLNCYRHPPTPTEEIRLEEEEEDD